jgi:hypothetical protein
MRTFRKSLLPAGMLLALFAATLVAAETPEYDALRAARPDGRRVAVSGLELQRDAFRLFFEEGTFHLLPPVAGRDFGAVFMGRGAYELHPATETERHHLRLVTGDKQLTVLTDRFTQIVLLFTDETAAEILAGGTLTATEPDARARAAYEDYLDQQRRRYQMNLHLRVLRDLLEPGGSRAGVFLAPVNGAKHDPALMVVDPLGVSAVAAKFAFFGGEQTGFYSTDNQNQGFWYLSSASRSAVGGRGRPASGMADAQHYEISTTIEGSRIEGETTIRFETLAEGVRVLPIRILPKLRIKTAVRLSPDGEVELGIIQEEVDLGRLERLFRDEVADADAAIVFPAPLVQGEAAEVRITYSGSDVVHGVGGNSYSVRARESWYPNLGTFTDLATYELTFRFPRRLELVSVGNLVDERVAGNQKVTVWKSERPMRVAGFNYGQFRKISRTDEVAGLTIDVYTSREWAKRADDAMADALNTARVARAFFGDAPYPRISVSQQVEWNFGQSWPSLVYLPTLALTSSTERIFGFEGLDPASMGSMNEFAKTVGWHEVAHQWWGHQVGWESYRDQWLSEGLAEFTAALVLHFTENIDKYVAFWQQRSKDILRNRGPITNLEAGAITQGHRLSTRRSPGAGHAIIYGKGGYVIHMLRMMMRDETKQNPDEAFIAMMKDFTSAYAGGNPSTDDFRKLVERHMTPPMDAAGDGTMNWFFDQWVHGTDVPTLTSELAAADVGNGQFRITGTISQKDVPEGFRTVIPIYLDFGRAQVRVGSARVTGTSSIDIDATIPLPQAPRRVTINAMRDVLSRN